ncbi:hypothetical protein [Achromobacter ruhlandii]|uniref:hypothetical protein n=1 Tax=Achromobacter ruhlandii TaxID=72557 RepID=UPI003017EB7D
MAQFLTSFRKPWHQAFSFPASLSISISLILKKEKEIRAGKKSAAPQKVFQTVGFSEETVGFMAWSGREFL